MNKKKQLKKDIEAVALQIVKNIHSNNYSTDQLSMVLKTLRSSSALFNLSSTARNNYIPLEYTKIEPANRNIENQKFFSTKKKTHAN